MLLNLHYRKHMKNQILVVNDGSQDNGKTRAIAEEYGDKIRYFEKENGGVSTALNLAIKEMTGDYFSWLSHDDMYYPNKIERNVEEILKCDDNSIVYSDYDYVNPQGDLLEHVRLDHKLLVKKPDYAVLRGMIGGITLLIPKKAFEDCGNFPIELRCTQDYELWFRMLDKYTFVHIPEILAMTRLHSMQDTNTSPKMLVEGNALWIGIAKRYPLEKKIKLEGSEYLFYAEMEHFLTYQLKPYRKAAAEVKNMAKECLERAKSSLTKKSLTVIIIDNGNIEEIKTTIQSVENCKFKNVEFIIEGETKIPNLQNYTSREEIVGKINTDYYSFITAGITVESNWLKEQLLVAAVTDKALIISDYDRPNKDNICDNILSLFVPIDGIIFNKKYNSKYINAYNYLYKLYEKGGSYLIDKKFLIEKNRNYNMEELLDFMYLLKGNNMLSDYEIASICYHISCVYNKYETTQQPVYMYEKCNELKELMFSRSFRLFKKYIDWKHERNIKKREKHK